MIRKLTHWIAGLTLAMLMMAVVLAGAAHAQEPAAPASAAIETDAGAQIGL